MIKRVSLAILLLIVVFSPTPAAAAPLHHTLLINQVRGSECCSPGSLTHLRAQLQQLEQLQLPATFALRFDVLNDPEYLGLLRRYRDSQQIELSAFLEITPSWAAAAGVEYTGDADHWYEAQHAYLIGYEPAARRQLIDTYMTRFHEQFGHYPQSSTGWMIDAWSLTYLREQYQLQLHQITREQLGVDSYTLYGGPAHYPYYPSPNWPLLPSHSETPTLPLIVRQTVTDPVHNYGDDSSAFTSQPNDYARRGAQFDYFQHLFRQAHQQAETQDTFTLLGLENSMPADIQAEYRRQLSFVAAWRAEASDTRLVVNARQFAAQFRERQPHNPPLTVYAGQDQTDSGERAWWITTPFYRVRLRLSAGELFISDWRLYAEELTDPYLEKSATKLGWWIMPFLLDGSRYPLDDQSLKLDRLQKDGLRDSDNKYQPTRLRLAAGLDPAQLQVESDSDELRVNYDGQTLAVFQREQVALPVGRAALTNNPLLHKLQAAHYWQLAALRTEGDLEWLQLRSSGQPDWLSQARRAHHPLLFPELREHPLAPAQSYLHKNNRYAIAGRNPVRLVFFPRDQYGYPVSLSKAPRVSVEPPLTTANSYQQSGQNGMIFIDLDYPEPAQFQLQLSLDDWQETVTVYFAPNCKADWQLCLRQPRYTWWYLNTIVHDKWRVLKEKWEKE